MAAAIPIAGMAMSAAGGIMNKDEKEVMKTMRMPNLTASQIELIEKLAGHLGGQIGEGVDMYEGLFTPGASPIQQEAYNRAGAGFTGVDFLDNLLQRGPEAELDHWQKSVVAPGMRNFEQNIVPQIMEKYASMNAGDSGAAHRALANAGVDLQTNMNAQLSDLMYQSQMGKANLAGQPINILNAIQGLGATARGIGAEKGAEQLQKWQQSQAWANPWLQLLGQNQSLLSARPYDNMAYSQMEGGSKTGKFLQGMGGAMMGGGGGGKK